MIGYNIEEIENLLYKMAQNYQDLGEMMKTEWPKVQTIMEAEWVGPDEVAYEAELVKNLHTLYYAFRSGIENVNLNVAKAGEAWIEFQKTNAVQGSTVLADNFMVIDIPVFDDYVYNIQNELKSKELSAFRFSNETRFGVVNGESSAVNINTALETYVSAIKQKANTLFSQMTTTNAFLGQSQADAIAEHIKGIAGSIDGILTVVEDIKKTLTTLVQNYTAQQQNITSAMQNAGSQAQTHVNMM